MGILKRLFSKKKDKEEEKKQQECWYNNAHEQKRELVILEGAGPSPNKIYYTTSQAAENAPW